MELLVAATMISVLFVGLGAHLRGGLTVWQRATSSGETLQQERVAFDRLERDLANAIVYDSRPEAYEKTTGTLPMPTFGEDALTIFTVSPAGGRQPVRVQVVRYTCDQMNGTSGLWRTAQSVAAAREREEPMTPELLLPGCASLEFRYAYLPAEKGQGPELEWEPRWPDANDPTSRLKLPRFIKVKITVKITVKSQVVEHEARRVCTVPLGVFGQSRGPST